MAIIKFDNRADGIGYLYRSAYYLAKQDKETAVDFLKKAFTKIEHGHFDIIKPLVKQPELLEDKTKQLYWAEKILDEYKRLSFLLRREDSNLQPFPYSIPSVTKRAGLSHIR